MVGHEMPPTGPYTEDCSAKGAVICGNALSGDQESRNTVRGRYVGTFGRALPVHRDFMPGAVRARMCSILLGAQKGIVSVIVDQARYGRFQNSWGLRDHR